MITNKEMGLKIAENREEKVYSRYEMELKLGISRLKEQLKDQEKILKMDMKTIWKKQRQAAEWTIRQIKDNLEIQEFILNAVKKKTGGFEKHELEKTSN